MNRELELAREFCALVDSTDLLEYLGVARDAAPEEAREALLAKRRRLQSMQNNPKFRDSALFLIKNVRSLEKVLDNPSAHLEHQRLSRENEKLPTLEFAVDSVMADGVLTVQETDFVRQAALSIGISEGTFERILSERAAARGIPVPVRDQPLGAEITTGEMLALDYSTDTDSHRLQGARGHSWWNASFTRLLLDCIPGGPGEMVDIYCRTALSALTVLPERRQLDWLGVEHNRSRLEAARRILRGRERIRFACAEPHALPIPDASVDFVLGIRALAHLSDTEPVFAEAMRVLRPGGRLILAEPDGFGETFYFDSHLSAYNAAFHSLSRWVDGARQGEARRPLGKPGIGLGPSLAERMVAAGFEVDRVEVHSAHNLKRRTFGKFAKLLRKYPAALASQAGLDSSALARIEHVVDALRQAVPDDHVGLCGNVLPMFLVVGVKE